MNTVMNQSTAIFLVRDDIRAIKCFYDVKADGVPDFGTVEIFKTFDTTIRKDDLVVVPTSTRVKMTVVKVLETDVEIDFDSHTVVKWIIHKVEPGTYEGMVAKEELMLSTIRKAEKASKKEELRKKIFANVPDADMKLIGVAPVAGQSETQA